MKRTSYRSYRVQVHCTSQWFASMWPPGSSLAVGGDPVCATLEEGEGVLMARVLVKIDEHIKAADAKQKGRAGLFLIRVLRPVRARAHDVELYL